MYYGVEEKLRGGHRLPGPQRSSRAKFLHQEGCPGPPRAQPAGRRASRKRLHAQPTFPQAPPSNPPSMTIGIYMAGLKSPLAYSGALRDCDGKACPYFSKREDLPVDTEVSRLLLAEGVQQTPSNHFKTREGLEDVVCWLFRISPSALAR